MFFIRPAIPSLSRPAQTSASRRYGQQAQLHLAHSWNEITKVYDANRPEVSSHLFDEECTADEYIALLATASDHRLMKPEKRDHLFSEIRRLITASPHTRIRRHNLTLLHLARKST